MVDHLACYCLKLLIAVTHKRLNRHIPSCVIALSTDISDPNPF